MREMGAREEAVYYRESRHLSLIVIEPVRFNNVARDASEAQ